MKKLTKKQVEKLIPQLLPYWKEMRTAQNKCSKEISNIQSKMNKKLSRQVKTSLEFFYVEGEIVGIGSEHWDDRKWFPLIHDTWIGF